MGERQGPSDLQEESVLIHTFGFRWKPGVTAAQIAQSSRIIRALQGQIPGLLNTWVGDNISPRSHGYQFGGVMQFTDRASLDAYNSHPAHQKVLEFLRPLIEAVEIDFEV